MNVLLIQNFGGLGGGSRSVFDIAKVFCELGHTVDIIFDNPSMEVLPIAKKLNVRIVEKHPPEILLTFHNASGLWIKSLIRFAKAKKNRKAWVNFFKVNDQYDLVVLNSSVLCFFCDILQDLRINNILIIRETFRKNFLMNFLQHSFLKKSSAVAYLTEFDKKQWQGNKKEYILPEIIDETLYEETKECVVSKNNFLYLGGLSYYKGAELFLRAALAITQKRPDLKCSYTILGNSYKEFDTWSILRKMVSFKHVNYRNKCNKIIQSIKKLNRNAVALVGLTTNISPYYKECKAVVFPVRKVHQPRPAYEAGLFKKAIILPDYDNFRDNITDSVNGFYYRKNDWRSLADVMIKVAEKTSETVLTGKNNWENTIKNHSLKNAKKIMQTILDSI